VDPARTQDLRDALGDALSLEVRKDIEGDLQMCKVYAPC
jgi:hypothetical protein